MCSKDKPGFQKVGSFWEGSKKADIKGVATRGVEWWHYTTPPRRRRGHEAPVSQRRFTDRAVVAHKHTHTHTETLLGRARAAPRTPTTPGPPRSSGSACNSWVPQRPIAPSLARGVVGLSAGLTRTRTWARRGACPPQGPAPACRRSSLPSSYLGASATYVPMCVHVVEISAATLMMSMPSSSVAHRKSSMRRWSDLSTCPARAPSTRRGPPCAARPAGRACARAGSTPTARAARSRRA